MSEESSIKTRLKAIEARIPSLEKSIAIADRFKDSNPDKFVNRDLCSLRHKEVDKTFEVCRAEVVSNKIELAKIMTKMEQRDGVTKELLDMVKEFISIMKTQQKNDFTMKMKIIGIAASLGGGLGLLLPKIWDFVVGGL